LTPIQYYSKISVTDDARDLYPLNAVFTLRPREADDLNTGQVFEEDLKVARLLAETAKVDDFWSELLLPYLL
jgi:hypothetical protein